MSRFTEDTVGRLGGTRPVLISLCLCREMWGVMVNSMAPEPRPCGLSCVLLPVIVMICVTLEVILPLRALVVVRGQRGISTCEAGRTAPGME